MIREQLLLLIETPIYIVFILGEMLLGYIHQSRTYEVKDTAINLMCTGLNMGLDLLMRGVTLAALVFAAQFTAIQIDNPFIYWILLFIGFDFFYYLLHLVDHYCRFFAAKMRQIMKAVSV